MKQPIPLSTGYPKTSPSASSLIFCPAVVASFQSLISAVLKIISA
jgi:hypothetical protein